VFKWENIVRDYELDSFGIVNHAVYVNYFEQSRNDYARLIGIDLFACLEAGFVLVIAGINIQYKLPLRAQDKFYIIVDILSYDKKRIYFGQEIRFSKNNKLIAKAEVAVACINQKTRRSEIPELLTKKIPSEKYQSRQ